MASEQQVKEYLAYWFQLGKKVLLHNGRETILPQPITEGDRYSAKFENCWQKILAREGKNCYLEGTNQTIEQLLAPTWDVTSCARCGMPVPTIDLGMQPLSCPCDDLNNWPNSELPRPRSPVDSKAHLGKIQVRLTGDRKQ
jgi:hypothetical protein